jgi:sensor histidine kinase YesM
MDLEMQALRAQMNPHFIFNCLSAIDNLIQTSQADKATSYLSKFAKLIRAVLDSSKNNLVPFQKDLETMQLYLEMEKFRCNNKFVYHLYVQPALLHGDYKVPPLIVQPFIENAIHHGLLNKKGTDRNLDISIKLEKEHIIYSIIDNGIGRQKAAGIKERNKPEHQSYGIAITRERIHLHNQNGIDDDLVITDLREEGIAAGTKAVIRINCSKS